MGSMCRYKHSSTFWQYPCLLKNQPVHEPVHCEGYTFWHLSDIVFVQKFTYIALLAQSCGLEIVRIEGGHLLASAYTRHCLDEPNGRCDKHARLALRSGDAI